MKRSIFAGTLALCAIFACNPLGNLDYQMPVPTPEQGDNENYTPELDINENGYDGKTASDKDKDKVVSDDEIYWENLTFGKTVTVI